MSETDAQDYFSIMPPTARNKAIAFERSRDKTPLKSASAGKNDKTSRRAKWRLFKAVKWPILHNTLPAAQ